MPRYESLAVGGRGARGLMCEIRADVSIGEYDFALVQGGIQAELGFEAIARIEQCTEVRVNRFERAKIAVEELPNHLAEPRIVLWETGRKDGVPAVDQSLFQ